MAGYNRRDVIKLESRTKVIHCFTKAYEYLLEAKTPSISEDFKDAWPTVLNAIKQVQRTGRAQELFITGKSVSYKNYEPQGDIKMKVTVVPKEDGISAAEYSFITQNAFSDKVKGSVVRARKFINPNAIVIEFLNRAIRARGDLPKINALKNGLINKMKRYGAPDDLLNELRAGFATMGDLSSPDVVKNLGENMKSIGDRLEQEGKLARGQIKIFVEPGVSDLMYKSAFFHELTHAFDPKVHLPYRVRGEDDDYYLVDPVELDASLNEFAVIAEEFPDEFNRMVLDIIKMGGDQDKFMSLVTKYATELGRHGIDDSKLMLYLERLLTLQVRIKKSSLRGVAGEKSQNKFMQKLINILDKPKGQSSKPLRDRLSDYKGSKKRDESQGFWDTPPPIPTASTPSAPAPSNKATPGVVDDSLLQEVLREAFGQTNGAYNYGRMAYGDRRITPQNSAFKPYPEVLAMCKNIIQRGVAGLSAAEAKQVVYLVAFIMVQKGSSLAFHLGKLLNLKTTARMDGKLFARLVKVAIEMEF